MKESTPRSGKKMWHYADQALQGPFSPTVDCCKAGMKRRDAKRTARQHRSLFPQPGSSRRDEKLHMHKTGSSKQGAESTPPLRKLRPGSGLKKEDSFPSTTNNRGSLSLFLFNFRKRAERCSPLQGFQGILVLILSLLWRGSKHAVSPSCPSSTQPASSAAWGRGQSTSPGGVCVSETTTKKTDRPS